MRVYQTAFCVLSISLMAAACSDQAPETEAAKVTKEKTEAVTKAVSEMKDTVSTAVEEKVEQASQAVAEVTEKTEEMTQAAKEQIGETTQAAADKTTEVISAGKEVVAEQTEAAKEAVSSTATALAAKVSASGVLSQDDAMALAKKSGCLACHAIDKKLVGPAWNDVAAKYPDDAASRSKLIDTVAKGGKGAWGNIAMPAQSPRVPEADVAQLVDFILTLK